MKAPTGIEVSEERSPQLQSRAVRMPGAQASPAGRSTGISLGQVAPPRAGLED